jgi:O-antigen ligase
MDGYPSERANEAGSLEPSVTRSRQEELRMSRLVWQVGRAHRGVIAGHRVTRGAALVAGLLAVDAIVAIAVVDARFQRLLMLGLAAVALALVFRFPFAATCGVLILVAGVTEPGRFKVPVGPMELRFEELLVGALLLVAVVRPRRAWMGGIPGWALTLFLAVVCLSGLLALSSGRATFTDAFATVRLFTPALLFFVVVRLFPAPHQVRRLLVAAVVIAAVGGVVALLVATPGSALENVLNPQGDNSIRGSEGLGILNRVRLSGVALAYALFWYTAFRALSAQPARRFWWVAAVCGMAVAIVLSLNRNMWIGLVLGMLMMLVLSRSVARRKLTLALVLVAAAGIGGAMAGTSVGADSPIRPVIERGSTLLNPSAETQDSSLQDRFLENRRAVATIERNPVVGVGPGASFGNVGLGRSAGGAVTRVDALFLHNQYLYLLLIGGPLALASFMVFLIVPVLEVFRRRWPDELLPSLAVGVVLIMLTAIVGMVFAHPTGSGVLALLIGAIVVLTEDARSRLAGAS